MPIVTVGRIVHYVLNASDVDEIMRRRTSAKDIRTRIDKDAWPIGAQAHVGSPVSVGDILPMLVVKVLADKSTDLYQHVNGRVMLDGTDELWVQDRTQNLLEGEKMPDPGFWYWPTQK